MKSLRENIQFYLIDMNTLPGKFIDMFILLLNILICLVIVLETYSGVDKGFLAVVETVLVVFFIVEYIARLYGSRKRWKHVFSVYSIIDLLTILPMILVLFPGVRGMFGVLRILKAFRILRFLRFTADPKFFFGDITMSVLKGVRLAMTVFIIFFVSSALFWQVENPVNPEVEHFGDAFYFTVVALTTVGFGDIIPLSEGGRAVTTLMIISGIIFIPWQISQLAKEWVNVSNKRRTTCKSCGLKYHDKDASHCKACGHLIYQEYDGG